MSGTDGDAIDADVVEPGARDDAAGGNSEVDEKLQVRVRCIESKGCFTKLSASDGHTLRALYLEVRDRFVPTYHVCALTLARDLIFATLRY